MHQVSLKVTKNVLTLSTNSTRILCIAGLRRWTAP